MFTYLREKHKRKNRFCFRVQYYDIFLTRPNFLTYFFQPIFLSFFSSNMQFISKIIRNFANLFALGCKYDKINQIK